MESAGEFDFIVPKALGESAIEKIGSADKELIIFENSGHSPMLNQPNDFVDVVKEFIEEHK